MANLPHPIQYQGSKRNLASDILRFLPKNIGRLVEPFSGTAAISIAAAARQVSQNFWINDLNRPLIKLLELIVEQPTQIADFYTKIWNEQHGNSVEHYYKIRDEFNKTSDPLLFLYLLSRCVKGSVRYNSHGLFNQSPDKRRKGTRPEKMRQNIEGVSHLLKNKCFFTALDYKDVLAKVDNTDFVYMDPPYQGVCGNRDSRYCSGISFDEFVSAIEVLNRKAIKFAISYDGKRGSKIFGNKLPEYLGLKKIQIEVGRSSQATLLGKQEITVESLYLSPTLLGDCSPEVENYILGFPKQLTLL
ncbi:MAG: DNA adenine methylase [Coleofasciculus sp. G3-WIS-01]|uniref:Dam family site-specific DNA-(adenine-N6)-methyltransferase n=1 Tax=Coleofasciculus sp. G3-WIS-01 TaxID=3069528 RepID=UPI0032F29FFD